MLEQVLLIIAALALVLLNGFFVAAEFAIVKVRATKVQELADEGGFRARIARGVLKNLDAYLSACQLGITFASLGLGWIGEPAVARLIEPGLDWLGIGSPTVVHTTAFVLAFIAISFLHIVLGEQAPKSLAIRKPEATTLWSAAPLRLFYCLMWPAIRLLNAAAIGLLRIVGLTAPGDGEMALSPQELRQIVAASHAHGSLSPTEGRLLENVIDFSERQVAEIMTPRLDMVCLFTDKTLGENIAIVREHKHTRYPLADETPDSIVGMIHVKDLLVLAGDMTRKGRIFDSVKRPVVFVPESASIEYLLKTFQRRRIHMAVVVDEYGGVSGLVTLEDVLEEIVGPIQDEFDLLEEPAMEQRGDETLVDAGLPIGDVAEMLDGLALPEDEDVRTIGGYVMKLLGRVPRIGESLMLGPYQVQVAEMDRLRVTRLRFRRIRPRRG